MKNIISRRQFLKAAGVSAVAATSASMMTACSSGAAGDDEIAVGLLGPKTGDVSVYGISVMNGANLYFNEVNAAGGVNGKQLVIVEKDEQGDETQAVTCFTQMVDEGIVGLVGDVTTTPTLAVVAESQAYNMPMVTASATAASVTYDEETGTVWENVYRSTFIDPFQGTKMADYAFEVLGMTQVAIIAENAADYQQGLATSFQAEFEALGGTITSVQGYATGDVDYKAQLTTIQSTNPDGVYCPNYYEQVGSILTQAREIGLDVPFMGGDGWDGVSNEGAQYASADALTDCYFCANYAAGASEAFESAYLDTYGSVYPNGFAPLGYDAAMTLVAGIEAAEAAGAEVGSDEYKQAIIDGIDVATIEGVTGTFTFDEYNNPIKTASIITFIDGVATYVENY
ncbi:MAG: ABC transporter substrate-binding protein [Faecalibacterium sp.]